MESLVLDYVKTCASGRLPLSDCGPVWQLGIIAVLLVLALGFLLGLRIHRHKPSRRRQIAG